MFVGIAEEARQAGEWAELQDVDHLVDWMAAHPEQFSLVVGTVDEQGFLRPDLEHRQLDRRPLASTIKIVALGAMARLVAEGERSLDDEVKLADIEVWYLPGSDGGAHEAALVELGLEVGQDATLTLDQVLRAMTRFSDNAATEWVLRAVGPERFIWSAQDGAMLSQEAAGSLVGWMLAWFNHDTPRVPTEQSVSEWEALSVRERQARSIALAEQLTGPWGEAERAWRQGGPPLHDLRLQARLAETSPGGTAADYAFALSRARRGFYHDPATSELLCRYLEWPMENASPDNFLGEFEVMGAKGGTLVGLMTEAAYYVPRTGPHAGEDRVVVLFMSGLNTITWTSLLQTFHHQKLMAELAKGGERLTQVQAALQSQDGTIE